jgi:hypothetical protein
MEPFVQINVKLLYRGIKLLPKGFPEKLIQNGTVERDVKTDYKNSGILKTMPIGHYCKGHRFSGEGIEKNGSFAN